MYVYIYKKQLFFYFFHEISDYALSTLMLFQNFCHFYHSTFDSNLFVISCHTLMYECVKYVTHAGVKEWYLRFRCHVTTWEGDVFNMCVFHITDIAITVHTVEKSVGISHHNSSIANITLWREMIHKLVVHIIQLDIQYLWYAISEIFNELFSLFCSQVIPGWYEISFSFYHVTSYRAHGTLGHESIFFQLFPVVQGVWGEGRKYPLTDLAVSPYNTLIFNLISDTSYVSFFDMLQWLMDTINGYIINLIFLSWNRSIVKSMYCSMHFCTLFTQWSWERCNIDKAFERVINRCRRNGKLIPKGQIDNQAQMRPFTYLLVKAIPEEFLRGQAKGRSFKR